MSLLSCFCNVFATVIEDRECIKIGILAIPACSRNTYCRAVTIVLAFSLAFMGTIDSFDKEEVFFPGSFGGLATLGGGALTGTLEHLKVQQQLLGIKGMSWSVRDSKNSSSPTLLYTQGELFSWHNSGHTRSGQTDELLSYWSNTIWSVRDIWEVYTYNNTCGAPLKDAQRDGKVLMYPFAKMTKHLWTLYPHYTVKRYECDGSLSEVWQIVPKYWLSALHHWLVREPSGRLVGTIDEKVSVFRHTLEAKITSGEDMVLFAHVIIFAGRPRGRSSSGSGSNSGGGSGNLRGGAAAR